ncbi:MAG: hypothetical protein AAF762_04335 [Pseudomonadota bacterium]
MSDNKGDIFCRAKGSYRLPNATYARTVPILTKNFGIVSVTVSVFLERILGCHANSAEGYGMSREDLDMKKYEALARRGSHDETVAILAVGDPAEWLRRGHRLPTDSSVAFASIDGVTPEALDRMSPTCVLSPALSHRFDCIDLAQILYAYGYKGRYRAMSHELPRPELVEREIAQLCPGLDFGILVSE